MTQTRGVASRLQRGPADRNGPRRSPPRARAWRRAPARHAALALLACAAAVLGAAFARAAPAPCPVGVGLAPAAEVATLEDLYGPTGDRFRAGFGMLNFEKAVAGDPDPVSAYGIGIDDVVFEWKEIDLVEDATECAPGAGGQIGGSCAAVELETTNFYEGRALLTISVIDVSPAVNNCDDDHVCENDGAPCDPYAASTGCDSGVACVADYGDAVDDLDCDDDGVADVRVEAETQAELAPGERVTLPCVSPAGSTCPDGVFRGTLPVSVVYDVAGVLFATVNGAELPEVAVTYRDEDDGTGARCSNHVDPAAGGRIVAATPLLIDTGRITVNRVEVLGDDGDGDAYADTGETVTVGIGLINRTGVSLTGVTARVATNDDKIDCILDSFAFFGDIAPGEEKRSAAGGDSFVLRVADGADRTAAGLTDLDEFAASFTVTVSADQFETTTSPLQFVLDLDLDAAGGAGPGEYFESFEVADGFGSFTTMNLDFGFLDGDPHANSAGYRCQYSVPWIGGSYSQVTDCYLGANGEPTSVDTYWWQLHRTTDIDGGRAYTGTQSLYMGVFGAAADEHTTPLAILEAIGSGAPVNLAPGGNPELSFVHQVSFMDTRTVNARPGRTADRGAVQIQLADASGAPVGDWIKLEPYRNVYDQQAEDNYTNCMFDPIDDGSTEDDFFDPSDPDADLGPSTLCFPGAIFANIGNTFDPFNGDVGGSPGGLVAEGPGLEGTLGVGTWIESRFNLQRFRGRRVRLRFVNSSLKVGSWVTYESLFANNPTPGDDGWWIDDVRITDTIDSPATVTADDDPPPGTPTCAALGCTAVTADLTPTPAGPLRAPGLAVRLSAAASTVDACPDGTLQYRFRDDLGGLLRDFTDNPVLHAAPVVTRGYTVDVRCSSDPACADTAETTLVVECPRSGNNPGSVFPEPIFLDHDGDVVTVAWTSPTDADLVGGSLDGFPAVAFFRTATAAVSVSVAVDSPAAYLLVRERGEFCNDGGSWNTGADDQNGDRDAVLP